MSRICVQRVIIRYKCMHMICPSGCLVIQEGSGGDGVTHSQGKLCPALLPAGRGCSSWSAPAPAWKDVWQCTSLHCWCCMQLGTRCGGDADSFPGADTAGADSKHHWKWVGHSRSFFVFHGCGLHNNITQHNITYLQYFVLASSSVYFPSQ